MSKLRAEINGLLCDWNSPSKFDTSKTPDQATDQIMQAIEKALPEEIKDVGKFDTGSQIHNKLLEDIKEKLK